MQQKNPNILLTLHRSWSFIEWKTRPMAGGAPRPNHGRQDSARVLEGVLEGGGSPGCMTDVHDFMGSLEHTLQSDDWVGGRR